MPRKEQLKELLAFSSGEKKGVIVLILIILIIIGLNLLTDFKERTEKVDFTGFEEQVAAFEASLKERNTEDYVSRLDKALIKRYDSLKLFLFNPNTITDTEWAKLGLTDKQVSTVRNYLNKGGRFYDKEDFRKIYGIRTGQFEILKPYIDLPDKGNYSKPNYSHYDKSYDYDKTDKSSEIPGVTEYFEFNPNEISGSDWVKLGFSQKQITTIQNYLSKGGRFYKKEDLKKIYGIKEFQYERIADYISLNENTNEKMKRKPEESFGKAATVDINKLSVEEFNALGGFWKYNGNRIVKYRNLLGGYTHKEQLLEIYGMKKKYYDQVADRILTEKTTLKQIRINFADVKELASHPYLEYHNAKEIIEFRDQYGFIKKLSVLREEKIISESVFKKIKPYLTVK